MRYVVWDDEVWIQAIGFQKYGPILPVQFNPEVLEKYRALTFERLREIFSDDLFFDKWIAEVLERRDQILRAASREAQGGFR